MSRIRKLLWRAILISEDLDDYKDGEGGLSLLARGLNIFLKSVHTQFSDLGLTKRTEEVKRA